MILNQYTPRCQGRIVGAFGAATLARDCPKCVRRTDIPADMQSVTWLAPLPPLTWLGTCPMHVAPAAAVAEGRP